MQAFIKDFIFVIVIVLLLIFGFSCGTDGIGATQLPAYFYPHKDMPEVKYSAIEQAMRFWNGNLGYQIFDFLEIPMDNTQCTLDGENTIYWDRAVVPDNSDGQARYRQFTDRTIGKEMQCDILVKSYSFGEPEYKTNGSIDLRDKGLEQLKWLMIHELGHCLGLDHSHDDTNVMFPIAGRSITKADKLQVLRNLGLKGGLQGE